MKPGGALPSRGRRPSVPDWLATMDWSARLGAVVMVVYAVVTLAVPLLAPHGESEIVGSAFDPWSAAFPLGTDNLGRDMLSRLLFGIRNTIGISIAASALSFMAGCSLGLLSAAVGGWFDFVLCRVVDVMMSVPQLIFSLLLLTILGTSIPVLILVIALMEATRLFRLSRALGMDVAAMDYMNVARMRGEGSFWLVRREILPNVRKILIAEAGLRFCFVFLLISALSFMGLGLQPPAADLGSMVRENADLITYGDITPMLPAAAIGVLTIAVNFVSDWYIRKTARPDASR
ncbi:ABC transporter permease [Labrys monachus]|uniref:Peptide/nickel transport system permease protein n=1 Tax=Labrys monachus TaxID=217067 RepID=A0ABU0FNL7_9HYPH|nr:ABC transporter permease [Labrys monachus]MDQ0396206.1 peptide/nickel transport system permease protein [Labrys monachus]